MRRKEIKRKNERKKEREQEMKKYIVTDVVYAECKI